MAEPDSDTYQCMCAEGMPEGCPCNTVPFTSSTGTQLFILTTHETRVIARALQITAVMAEALDNDVGDLVALRDRFAPDGLEEAAS